MNDLTLWHYLLLLFLSLAFAIGSVLAFRSDSKYSMIASLFAVLTLVGFFSWTAINDSVYHVEVVKLDHHRIYQREKIVINGIVKNKGEYGVSNVVATVKLKNSKGASSEKASQFSQPTAFAELFEGDNPDFKPQNVSSSALVTDYLKPGGVKSFTVIMDYPPYFKTTTITVELSVN